MRNLKKNLFVIMLLLTALGICYQTKELQAYSTKSQVKKAIKVENKKVKAINKNISKINKTKKTVEKKIKKVTRGATFCYLSQIEYRNPAVIYDRIGRRYFYLTNAKNSDLSIIGFSGWVKPQGGIQYINGITCQKAKVVRVPKKISSKENKILAKKSKLEKQLESSKDKIKKLKDTLTFSPKGYNIELEAGKGGRIISFNHTYNKISYKSSNNNVCTVSKDGVVMSSSAGRAIITATASISKKTAKYSVEVYQNANDIQINTTKKELMVGESIQMDIKVLPDGYKNGTIVYTTSGGISVSDTGLVTAHYAGKAKLNVSLQIDRYHVIKTVPYEFICYDSIKSIEVYNVYDDSANYLSVGNEDINKYCIKGIKGESIEISDTKDTLSCLSSNPEIATAETRKETTYLGEEEDVLVVRALKPGEVTITLSSSSGVKYEIKYVIRD